MYITAWLGSEHSRLKKKEKKKKKNSQLQLQTSLTGHCIKQPTCEAYLNRLFMKLYISSEDSEEESIICCVSLYVHSNFC